MFERLGKFQIQRLLGQGAMGEVYLAFDPVLGREVAIKTILPTVAHGEEAVSRFEREAKAVGKLNHPHIVTIHEFGEDQGVLYIAMEYVQGHDLGELLQTQAISHSETLEILAQVCDGLYYAHRNGIIHRDIKPSNVRVVRDGNRLHAKVMDFGVARVGNSDMTATGMVMGTVCYMAPEYILTGTLDPRSDLFAVGVMLYEALSGRKPFMGDTTPTILYKIVHEAADPIDLQTFDGISPATRSVLNRALAKDPDERFQTGETFAKALRAAKDPTWQGEADQATSRMRTDAELTASAAAREEPTELTREISRGVTGSGTRLGQGAGESKRWLIPAGIALAAGLVVLGIVATRKDKSSAPPNASESVPPPAPPVPAPTGTPSVVPPPVSPSKGVPAQKSVPPATAAQPPVAESFKAMVYFERLNLQADLIMDNRERLIIEGNPGDPMRKVLTPISVGRHHLHYQVSRSVRYHADIEVKAGDNYLRPSFQYDTLPGLSRNLSYQEGQENAYAFDQSQDYWTYDANGLPVRNNGVILLNVMLTKDPQNNQIMIAAFHWQIFNQGKELSRGSIENTHLAGAPWTRGEKILYQDGSMIYYIKYHMADTAIQVELSGSFGKTI